jgi:SAM-dependent methyltransferase
VIRRFVPCFLSSKPVALLKALYKKIKLIIYPNITENSGNDYWEKRVLQYGARAALNIAHSDSEYREVTEMQMSKIFPFVKQLLTGSESTVLDIGCGPGRFTLELAKLIQGNTIGVDPIQAFLDIAPRHQNVEYKLLRDGIIPVEGGSVDFVWICLVLGGITDEKRLNNIVREVNRVLKPGGIVILVENTTDVKNVEYWSFRSVDFYMSLLDFAELEHFSDYYDLGERISIFGGRKHV